MNVELIAMEVIDLQEPLNMAHCSVIITSPYFSDKANFSLMTYGYEVTDMKTFLIGHQGSGKEK